MTHPVVLEFLQAAIPRRFELALDSETAPAIEAYMGAGAFASYRRLAESAGGDHLAAGGPVNVVFVPGVMGSLLQSEGLGGVWWVDVRTRGHIEDLRLSPDGNGDADPRSRISPFSIDTSYEPFLAASYTTPDFNHRFFAFDWRKSLRTSTGRLRALIEEVHAGNGGEPVHLVGHSMGGLMIRATLMEHGDALWPILGKVCFIGTPHYGSPAIAGYLKHHFWGFEMLIVLRKFLSRAAFRSLRGVMELLPAPAGVYPGTRADRPAEHPCGNFDFYDAGAWKLDLQPQEQSQLQAVLDAAAAFHRDLHDFHGGLDQELRDRMAMIAGVGRETLFRMEFRSGLGGVWKEMNKITDRVPGDPHRDGDGRVPLASAQLANVGQLRYVEGTHGDLPNLPAVSADVFRWLRGESMQLPDTPQQALADHLGVDTLPGGEDPGFLAALEDEPTQAELDALDAELEAGRRPEFIHAKLL